MLNLQLITGVLQLPVVRDMTHCRLRFVWVYINVLNKVVSFWVRALHFWVKWALNPSIQCTPAGLEPMTTRTVNDHSNLSAIPKFSLYGIRKVHKSLLQSCLCMPHTYVIVFLSTSNLVLTLLWALFNFWDNQTTTNLFTLSGHLKLN